MESVYALEELPKSITKSIFLAGPTPRDESGKPWRQEAEKILEELGFDGAVYIPEPRDGKWHGEYDAQVEWEELCLNQADCIVFWVPRELKTMPAFTTNIEWGRWESSGKIVLGYPKDAEKMSYMKSYANKLNIPTSDSLKDTLKSAIDFIGEGDERTGGERMVPLYVWNTPQFKNWYHAQTEAGNRLDDARVLYNFRPENKTFVFLWVLHVDMYIASEDRHKTNEFVLSRTDISSVLMWKYDHEKSIGESEIVLIREYRSPASTKSGFIYELPGGSAPGDDNPEAVAAEEVFEETGMHIDSSRLKFEAAHQLAGTLSAHQAHLFSVQLTEEEMDWMKSQKDVVHGNVDDTEQTYIEVMTLDDILGGDLVDWATLGEILSIIMPWH